mmetsp:Transcript_17431/g.42744  ORF Transcript_17431/g.42744 Transcript_17431/m.42744 type:complete len:147 (-) Transcript_17431:1595-2035(-)
MGPSCTNFMILELETNSKRCGTLPRVIGNRCRMFRFGFIRQCTRLESMVPISLERVNGQDYSAGDLTVGYGEGGSARGEFFGPELGFGFNLELPHGASKNDKILLVKTAWGGKDLAQDFRPPSILLASRMRSIFGRSLLQCHAAGH